MDTNFTTFEYELARSGKLIYTNVGVSMLPLLREGRDIMLIQALRGEPKRLDAVLFRRPNIRGRGGYVLHRILRRKRDGTFWIVGDNCTDGETVKREDILGVLTAIKRGDRTINVSDLRYRLYVALWCAPYHLRFLVLFARRFFAYAWGGVKHKILYRIFPKINDGEQ